MKADLIRRVTKLRPEPGDVIVIETADNLSEDAARQMRELLTERFPDQKCLIACRSRVGLLREVA